MNVPWENRKCRASSFHSCGNGRDGWLPGQSPTVLLQCWGIHLQATGPVYDRQFCEAGILKDFPSLSWQSSPVNFPHLLLVHCEDSVLSAAEARAGVWLVPCFATVEANSSWRFFSAHRPLWSRMMVLQAQSCLTVMESLVLIKRFWMLFISCRCLRFLKSTYVSIVYQNRQMLFVSSYLFNFGNIYKRLKKGYFCN